MHFKYRRVYTTFPKSLTILPLEWGNGRNVSNLPGQCSSSEEDILMVDVIISDPALSRQVKLCGVHTLLKRNSVNAPNRDHRRWLYICPLQEPGPLHPPGAPDETCRQAGPSWLVGRELRQPGCGARGAAEHTPALGQPAASGCWVWSDSTAAPPSVTLGWVGSSSAP